MSGSRGRRRGYERHQTTSVACLPDGSVAGRIWQIAVLSLNFSLRKADTNSKWNSELLRPSFDIHLYGIVLSRSEHPICLGFYCTCVRSPTVCIELATDSVN